MCLETFGWHLFEISHVLLSFGFVEKMKYRLLDKMFKVLLQLNNTS